MGGFTSIPVMVARGAIPGHVIGITAALHGNELNGIPLIHTCVPRSNACLCCRLIVASQLMALIESSPRKGAAKGCAASGCVYNKIML